MKILEVKTEHTSAFKTMIEVLKELLPEANIEFRMAKPNMIKKKKHKKYEEEEEEEEEEITDDELSEVSDDDESDDDDEPSETILLTVTYGEEILSYTLEELEGLEYTSGSGSYVKSQLLPDEVVIKGPYSYTGIELATILNDFESLPENYNLTIISSDEWTSNLTKDQVNGIIDIYDDTGTIISQSGATIILAFKEDDEYITDEEIGPLRIAIVGDDAITLTNLLSKMVVSIQIIDLS